mmetsp:Transcript_10162/g.14920  ORF Transcript_10162/g.14920 Transcript_10162/m.14920 type:complete len:266 (+) Transcript_10162:68-865(+)
MEQIDVIMSDGGPGTPPNQPRTPIPPLDDEDDDEIEDDEDDDEEEVDEDEDEDESQDGMQGLSASARNIIRAVPDLDSLYGQRDLQKDAICWTLSSAKPGNGVDQIRDSSQETYWQSDGGQPHFLQVVFSRRVAVSHVCLYLDYNLDESYTPKKVCVETGMTLHDLQTVSVVELQEPVGWCIIPLDAPPDPLDEDIVEEQQPIRTHLVQVSVLTMHQNGRDTHVRQVKLFGPKREHQLQQNTLQPRIGDKPNFTTVTLSQFSTIR